MPISQITDQPIAPRVIDTRSMTHTHIHTQARKTDKATKNLFLSDIIAERQEVFHVTEQNLISYYS